MKHIRSAIAAGLLVFGTAALASAQAPVPPATQGQRAQRGHGQHGKRAHAWGKRGPGRALFKGIQLSDAEKANIKAVHTKYEPQMKALREQFKTQRQSQGKIARGDTAAMRARREANAPQREQMQKLFLAEQGDLRGALTAENQAKFDANMKQVQQHVADRAAKRKGKFAGRGR